MTSSATRGASAASFSPRFMQSAVTAPEAIPHQATGGPPGAAPVSSHFPMVSESGGRVRAQRERDAEVAQASPGPGGVVAPGGGGAAARYSTVCAGAADHHEQVRRRAEQDGDRLAARRAQAAQFTVAGIRGTGDLGHQQRRMRADRGRDQHLVITQRLPDVPELTGAAGGPCWGRGR